jgi:hypothetical protein
MTQYGHIGTTWRLRGIAVAEGTVRNWRPKSSSQITKIGDLREANQNAPDDATTEKRPRTVSRGGDTFGRSREDSAYFVQDWPLLFLAGAGQSWPSAQAIIGQSGEEIAVWRSTLGRRLRSLRTSTVCPSWPCSEKRARSGRNSVLTQAIKINPVSWVPSGGKGLPLDALAAASRFACARVLRPGRALRQ